MKIEKCLKVILSKHMIIVPFNGNLTSTKKDEIAESIQDFLYNRFEKNVSVQDVITSVFNNAYGSVEKNLTIENHGVRSSFHGEGWSSSNMPNNNYTILKDLVE